MDSGLASTVIARPTGPTLPDGYQRVVGCAWAELAHPDILRHELPARSGVAGKGFGCRPGEGDARTSGTF